MDLFWGIAIIVFGILGIIVHFFDKKISLICSVAILMIGIGISILNTYSEGITRHSPIHVILALECVMIGFGVVCCYSVLNKLLRKILCRNKVTAVVKELKVESRRDGKVVTPYFVYQFNGIRYQTVQGLSGGKRVSKYLKKDSSITVWVRESKPMQCYYTHSFRVAEVWLCIIGLVVPTIANYALWLN